MFADSTKQSMVMTTTLVALDAQAHGSTFTALFTTEFCEQFYKNIGLILQELLPFVMVKEHFLALLYFFGIVFLCIFAWLVLFTVLSLC